MIGRPVALWTSASTSGEQPLSSTQAANAARGGKGARIDLTRTSSAAASERSPREAVRHRRGARTGEHREHANQSATGDLLKYCNHEEGGSASARRRLQR